MSVLDDIDFTEFNKYRSKYDTNSNAKLEKNNAMILEIYTIGIPDLNVNEEILDEQESEIKEQEDYLEEHNKFLNDTMNYCRYISNMRKQVDNRLLLIEKKTRKRFEPKIDQVFEEKMNIKKQRDEIPKIKDKMIAEHKQTIGSIENEKEMMKANARDLYHKEKDMLAEIARTDNELEQIRRDIEDINNTIAYCKELKVEIATIRNHQIPAIEREIASINEEIQTVGGTIADEEQRYDDLKTTHDSILEQNSELDKEFDECCAVLTEYEAKIQALGNKHTIAEIEADGRFDDIVASDFYQEEKTKYMELMADHVAIANDLNNFHKSIAERTEAIQRLNAEIEAMGLTEKRAQLQADLSQLIDEEVEKIEESRRLERQLQEAEMTNQKTIYNLEIQAQKLTRFKEKLERRMEAKFAEIKSQIDADLKKKQQKPIFSGRLTKKKSAPLEEDVTPPKKPKLDPKAALTKVDKKKTPPQADKKKTKTPPPIEDEFEFDNLAKKSPQKGGRRAPVTRQQPKPAEETSSGSSIDDIPVRPHTFFKARTTTQAPQTTTQANDGRFQYKPYFIETDSELDKTSASDIADH